jgi:hypothetical protein
MPLVIPDTINALNGITPPSTTDPLNFDTRADIFLGALPSLQNQVNTVADQTYDNASEAYTKAVEASTSAASAAVSASSAALSSTAAAQYTAASMWVAGSYPTGTVVWSPLRGVPYRRKSPGGASPTDPALDLVNWTLAVVVAIPYVLSTDATIQAVPSTEYGLQALSAQNVVMPDPATLEIGSVVGISIENGRLDNYLTLTGGASVNGELQEGNILIIDDEFARINVRWSGVTYGWSI